MKMASAAIVTSNMNDANNNVISIICNTHTDKDSNKKIDKNKDMH